VSEKIRFSDPTLRSPKDPMPAPSPVGPPPTDVELIEQLVESARRYVEEGKAKSTRRAVVTEVIPSPFDWMTVLICARPSAALFSVAFCPADRG